jgi:S-formylglutathione hydrolase FrmB
MKTKPEISAGAQYALRVAALTGILSPLAGANAGTPLMLLTFAHLIFGNAIIGLVEGLLLWLMFRKSAHGAAVPLMIAANYLSAFVGLAFLVSVSAPLVTSFLLPADPTRALAELPEAVRTAAWVAYPAAYVLTVVLEWPFVFVALKPRSRRVLTALGASVVLQAASYAVLVPLYLSAATVTLDRDVSINSDVVTNTHDNAWIYFLDNEQSTLKRIRINGEQLEPVSTDVQGELRSLRVAQGDPAGPVQLVADTSNAEAAVVIPEFCTLEKFPWKLEPGSFDTNSLRDETEMRVRSEMGLALMVSGQNDSLFLAFDTHLLFWRTSDAWPLPDQRVVYQFGPWIVLLDFEARRIGVIAEGHSPVPVLDESPMLDTADAVDISVEGPSESANGFTAYTVNSPYQSRPTQIEVLPPDVMASGETYPVLYLLPVNDGIMNQWGSGIVEARKHDLANRFNVICVSPEYDYTPWYGNHPSDPALQQETYLLDVVMPVIEARYPVVPGKDGRILLGFSKSGFGAIAIALRNLDRIGKAAAWDAPLMMTSPFPNEEEMMRVFVSQANFDPYCVPTLVEKHAAELQSGPPRFVLVSNGSETGSIVDLHYLLEKHQVPHRFLIDKRREHTWTSDWLPVVTELLFAPDDTPETQ